MSSSGHKRTVPYSLTGLRRATRLGDIAERRRCSGVSSRHATSASRTANPACRKGVVVPPEPSKLGANFETAWARGTRRERRARC